MTVQANDTRIPYVTDGIASSYAFNMKTLDTNWIDVYENELVSASAFNITLNVDQKNNPGGFVVFTTTPVADINLLIERNVPTDQLIDYTSYNGFPADVSENGLDKLTLVDQQIEYDHTRTIMQYKFDDSRDMELPSNADRALRFLTFDSVGNVSVSDLLAVDIAMELGTLVLSGSPGSVVFVTPKASTNYKIWLQVFANETVWPSNMTTTGFTINSSNAGSTARVDWNVTL